MTHAFVSLPAPSTLPSPTALTTNIPRSAPSVKTCANIRLITGANGRRRIDWDVARSARLGEFPWKPMLAGTDGSVPTPRFRRWVTTGQLPQPSPGGQCSTVQLPIDDEHSFL